MELANAAIESSIFDFRGSQVMVDKDLATMFQVETKVLNQAVKRNIDRFPEYFRFQLNVEEKNELVTTCDRFKSLKRSISKPFFVFSISVHRSKTLARMCLAYLK